jgi:phosphopantothenoylcysteine decarboxylase/phosphopantothenate--cysteine ligase
MLRGKKFVIGVTGSIAAYKTAILVRLLIKEGAEVKVIMTDAAKDFITPLTLSTLSRNPVLGSFFEKNSGTWESHVDLGLWADAMLVAPASANTIAKMANGLCDNLLTAVYLSARCPVFIAPAMDLDMYQHPSTTANIATLADRNAQIVQATHGELASGLIGEGRMAEPEEIVSHLSQYFESNQPLKGKKALVTAGPTNEAIDPVRFIGNHSSGKMGYAIAEYLAQQGAAVELISGPTSLRDPDSPVSTTRVQSAQEMYDNCEGHFADADIVVLAAAVADYRPAERSEKKIKKDSDRLTIELEKTVDIAESLGKRKRAGQMIVGFALETDNELENARKKLKKKNFDLVVLNSLNDMGAGFGYDTNKITILSKDETLEFDLKSKAEVAKDIVNAVIRYLNA